MSPNNDKSQTDRENDVQVSGWSQDTGKVYARTFPGPDTTDEPLRIHFSREAYAAILGHAKESLDAEICGVMVGDLCEDDRGLFVDVKASIRGKTNKRGGTHVTFTQETWDDIYQVKEKEYPKLRLVGWYHSHPGFGVVFSEMDLFIQRNFFSGLAQFALVADPLSGEEAICANINGEVSPIRRFWVDGRERTCNGRNTADSDAPAETAASADLNKLEQRIGQLIQSIEEHQAGNARMHTFLAMLVGAILVVWIGYNIFDHFAARTRPPEKIGEIAPIPIPDKNGQALGYVGVRAYWSQIAPQQTVDYIDQLINAELKDPVFRQRMLEHIAEIEKQEKSAAEKKTKPAVEKETE